MKRLRLQRTKASRVFQTLRRPKPISVKKSPHLAKRTAAKGINRRRQLRKASPSTGRLRKRKAAARPRTTKTYKQSYDAAYNTGYNAGFAKGFEDGHLYAYTAQP